MKGKKKRAALPLGQSASKPSKQSAARRSVRAAEKRNTDRAVKAERRAAKLERRLRREKGLAETWEMPVPAHLVGKGKLERSNVSSKYHSYFEFAENTERKDKKLEFQVTNDATAPPGFKFVPIGHPTLTNACKELSRARGAMIFIVSGSREEELRIKEHIFRLGYHFRESIVDEARDIVGLTASDQVYDPSDVEPIPESQEEINQQADGAIRDLFPRIPNTDRQMIIGHAFQKGATFHGEPTVGLQTGIPLSRRVQLAVLAHIRHTHTRYDLLLRETTWMNARKVVEPVCLDVLVKWRGDEETGRDQMEEILREVVVITDSEDDSSEEEDSSEGEEGEDGEVTSASPASVSLPNSRNQRRSTQPQSEAPIGFPQVQTTTKAPTREKGRSDFKRYQAWNEALTRGQENYRVPEAGHAGEPVEGISNRLLRPGLPSPYPNDTTQAISKPPFSNNPYGAPQDHGLYYESSRSSARQEPYHAQPWPRLATNYHRDEVTVRPLADRHTYHQSIPWHATPSHAIRVQGPPVVVTASPTSNGLQDLLVPSIETASSDALLNSPRPGERHEVYGGQQLSYRQLDVERRWQSPAPRQVLVINDDSPLVKRRRVVYEDGAGHFRPAAYRDQDLYPTAPRAESHLSSVQPRECFVRRERLPYHLSDGSSRMVQSPLTGAVGQERLPFFNPSLDSGHTTSLSDRYRRVEDSDSSIRQDGPPMKSQLDPSQSYFGNRGEGSLAHRPVNGDMGVIEHDRIRQVQADFSARHPVQRISSPAFAASRTSRPNELGPAPVDYQAFVDNFSQSRLDPPLPRARDDYTVVSERSHHNFVARDMNSQRYEDRPADSFITLRSAEARSPVQYVERPTRIQGERVPLYYDNGQPAPERYHNVDRPPPIRLRSPAEGESAQYIRTVRRPIVEID